MDCNKYKTSDQAVCVRYLNQTSEPDPMSEPNFQIRLLNQMTGPDDWIRQLNQTSDWTRCLDQTTRCLNQTTEPDFRWLDQMTRSDNHVRCLNQSTEPDFRWLDWMTGSDNQVRCLNQTTEPGFRWLDQMSGSDNQVRCLNETFEQDVWTGLLDHVPGLDDWTRWPDSRCLNQHLWIRSLVQSWSLSGSAQ